LRGPSASNEVASDRIATAQRAGLRYTNTDKPGIRRKRSGRGFACTDRDGVPMRDKGELGRIRRLAIPPAWTDVWISPSPIGHIQATGRDGRGRKQYRYHRSEEHTSELQSRFDLVCRLLLEKKKPRKLVAPFRMTLLPFQNFGSPEVTRSS